MGIVNALLLSGNILKGQYDEPEMYLSAKIVAQQYIKPGVQFISK